MERIDALVADDVPDDDEREDETAVRPVLATIKEAPGNVSLETMLTEIDRLRAVRAIGLPPGLFDDVAPKIVDGWRTRAAVEWPSHLRDHPQALRLTLLAALLYAREREITDTLVDLVIATVHRIGARAEKKVTEELVNAFKRVSGKEHILFKVAEASLAAPEGVVRQVVFPAVAGGESTLWGPGARVQDQRLDLSPHGPDHAARLLHQSLPPRADRTAGCAWGLCFPALPSYPGYCSSGWSWSRNIPAGGESLSHMGWSLWPSTQSAKVPFSPVSAAMVGSA